MGLLFWLVIKHFICDFPLQAFPWMYKNKGTYGHPGGIVHALVHFAGTFMVVALSGELLMGCGLALLDGTIHYHIDYAKMRLGNHYNLKPDNSEWFWILLGFDQLLHYLTYFLLWWLYNEIPI